MTLGRRVLLLATTTGYQTRAFGNAARHLGVELVFATDRCDHLDDPWRDGAIPIRFHDEAASVDAIVGAARLRPFHGVLVVGDRPTIIGALAAGALGIPWHPVDAARAAANKEQARQRFLAASMPVPAFQTFSVHADPDGVVPSIGFPCVVKPLALAASRGVIRADDGRSFRQAFARVAAILMSRDVRSERNALHGTVLVEEFVPGREIAVEGLLHEGALQVLAVFDKPDPLDGPFFEETIYVTPSTLPSSKADGVIQAVARGAAALGLCHGPIHAECRLNDLGVYVLEIAARPIGGLCARALTFENGTRGGCSLEELLLRHALGEPTRRWSREEQASAVMMIPIPQRGILRDVGGLADARAVAGVDDVVITAKPDQRLVPLPEGSSYLGFIFARGATPRVAEHAVRQAHARLRLTIDPDLLVVQSHHG